jgi:hypothetical protein
MDLNMSRVFVVQQTMSKDRRTGLLSPRFDMTPAEEFGDIVCLLTPNAKPFNPVPVIEELREKLIDFSDDDYLLCAGSPILIGWATAIAAYNNEGRVAMLQWSGINKSYAPVEAMVLYDT